MTFGQAHAEMDILLDKADQPYFTTQEKDKFLNLAISDFINFHYQKMTADEYEANSDTIMEAIRAGNFIYDVSGSAR